MRSFKLQIVKICLFFLLCVDSLPAQHEIVYVKIDDQDMAFFEKWPINRRWFAVIAETSINSGATSVFIDVSFKSADLDNDISDEFLYRVIKKFNVYVQHHDSIINEENLILGQRVLASSKYWNQFDAEIDIKSDYIHYRPSQSIRDQFKLTKASYTVPFPQSTDTLTAYSIRDIIDRNLDLNNKHIVVGTDIDGLTSYLPLGDSDELLTPTEIRIHAIKAVLDNRLVTELYWWIILGFLTATVLIVYVLRSLLSLSFLALWIPILVFSFSPTMIIPLAHWIAYTLISLLALGFIFYRHSKGVYRIDSEQMAKHHQQVVKLSKKVGQLEHRLSFYESDSTVSDDESSFRSGNIVYDASSPIRKIIAKIETVSQSHLSVFIEGETGTGKEEVAKLIHQHSDRHEAELVAINCGAFSQNLIESELFGHEKGAFTGAVQQKIGKFELANNSTLFLDEIADMPLETQVKILRVLQEGVFERVGGNTPIETNVRVISATHKHIDTLIEEGAFREDLYYRLNGYHLNIPPLRERKQDITAIVRHHLVSHYSNQSTMLNEATLAWLKDQPWNGNVRELLSSLDRAFLNAEIDKRQTLIPQDFELKGQVEHQDLDQTALSILDKMREKEFKHNAISQIADELKIHRVTVTENWRGIILRHYAEAHANVDVCIEEILQDQKENQHARERIDTYLTTMIKKIKDAIKENLSFDLMKKKSFYNLPKHYKHDLEWIFMKMKENV